MTPPNEIESVLPCSGRYSLKADLRLNVWMAVTMLVYFAALYLTRHHEDWPPLARGLLGLMPLLPGLLYVRSWYRFIRGMDEFQRRLQLEVMLLAALGTVLLAVVLGTLSAAGVELGPLRHGLGIGLAFIVMIILWTIGTVARLRHFR
ncbi:MAG TPA: hypothetical protein VHE13_18380 [Opitutus sp.]|nr:hypothetical protein [Opitutus sp.]